MIKLTKKEVEEQILGEETGPDKRYFWNGDKVVERKWDINPNTGRQRLTYRDVKLVLDGELVEVINGNNN